MQEATERPLRLLVVDDDPGESNRIEDLVRMAVPGPTEVLHADWAAEVPDGPLGRQSDWLLCRLRSPGVRALADLRRILEALPAMPVVALVDRSEESLGLQAVSQGAQDYLVAEELSGPLLARTVATSAERGRYLRAELDSRSPRDPLTGLAGRELLLERLRIALARLRRRDGAVAVLCIDLDRFTALRGEHGHEVADRLLTSVAERLRALFREEDTVGRWGSDRFFVICEDMLDDRATVRIGERAAEALEKAFTVGGRELAVTASVGACLVEEPSDRPEDVLIDAEAAMLRAKQRRKESPLELDPQLVGPAVVPDGAALLQAVEGHELRLFHQPIVNLATTEVQGSEVLVRWQHPDRGFLEPGEFLPAAKAAGVLKRVGEWVLAEACLQAASIQAITGPGRLLPVTVNLAAEQVTSLETVDRVVAALSAAKLAPELLGLEVTERALLEEPEVAARVLEGLRDLGVRLALDDFGLGDSSPEPIERFGIHLVKLDRDVIEGVHQDPERAERVRYLADQVHAFRIPVLAEGVESAEEGQALLELGCDLAQGYLFGRPQPLEGFVALLEQSNGQVQATQSEDGHAPQSSGDGVAPGGKARGPAKGQARGSQETRRPRTRRRARRS
jgi:diguanylate cyclase (GGDEF)-like protein